jgi:hypothetical protein
MTRPATRSVQRLYGPAYAGCPAKHYRLLFGRYKGWMLARVPGWYLHFLLTRPTLNPSLRSLIFATLRQSSDRRHAVDAVTTKAALRAQRPVTARHRKETP